MLIMKVKVTEQGVLIPKWLFPGVSEVEVSEDSKVVMVAPAMRPDPISLLGKDPVLCDVDDASENHDAYICGRSK
jgi:hypothetical protein